MPTTRIVQPGECLSLYAFEHGLTVDTIWNAPENDALRKSRSSPHVLAEGDEVFVPDLRGKIEMRAAGAKYRFRRRGVPEIFRLELRNANEPRKEISYTIEFRAPGGNVSYEGKTDEQGRLQHFLPPDATGGTLRLPEENETYELRLARLAPIASDLGIRQRLFNLGHLKAIDADDEALRAAVRAFHFAQKLFPEDALNDETRKALAEAHGC